MRDRSCYVLSGEARESWRHGIGRIFEGSRYKDEDFERISLTVRHVIDSRRKIEVWYLSSMLDKVRWKKHVVSYRVLSTIFNDDGYEFLWLTPNETSSLTCDVITIFFLLMELIDASSPLLLIPRVGRGRISDLFILNLFMILNRTDFSKTQIPQNKKKLSKTLRVQDPSREGVSFDLWWKVFIRK